MVFDSRSFLIFFAVFFVAYHTLSKRLALQNALALLGSCVFYGAWDWRFLGLLLLAAGIDYLAGRRLDATLDPVHRRRVLAVSMTANLGILFTFKYFDFFVLSLAALGHKFGWHLSVPTLHVVLPVGISFYTFQSMSYTIDIYRGQAKAERNPITYFTFVSFFPHMVAGPIQRSSHLLRQLNTRRSLDAQGFAEGIWLLTFGYFLKEVVADPLSTLVGIAFTTERHSGWLTVFGTIAFGFQIYCDFNAYSIIARGLGRLLGIEFIWNFKQPYFATSPQEFWRRWHISLSTWLRDYLYVPLGGNRRGSARTYANLLITMVLGGLWHGAAWNFVLWGLLHGLALAINRAWQRRSNPSTRIPTFLAWFATMSVVFAGWLLFRCNDGALLRAMLASLSHWEWPARLGGLARTLVALTAPVAAIEIWQFKRGDLLAPLSLGRWSRAGLAGVMLYFVVLMFSRFDYEFIYFQF